MIVVGHSSLDVGARIKSDPEFYNIGSLDHIEDMGGLVVARVTKKGRIIPTKAGISQDKAAEKAERKSRAKEGARKRERKIVVEFDW